MTSEDTEVDEARSGSKDFQCSTAQITSGLMSFAPQGGVSEASASRSSHPFLPPGGMERVRGSVSVR